MKIANATIVVGLLAMVPAFAQHLEAEGATLHVPLMDRLAQMSAAIPEPISVALLAAGIAACGTVLRRRTR